MDRKGDSAPSRKGDRLIKLPEIMEIWPVPEPTIRWLRHRGDLTFIFKSGGRLMCWESDLYAHIEAEAAKDAQQATAS
jgi:hypothetical protein